MSKNLQLLPGSYAVEFLVNHFDIVPSREDIEAMCELPRRDGSVEAPVDYALNRIRHRMNPLGYPQKSNEPWPRLPNLADQVTYSVSKNGTPIQMTTIDTGTSRGWRIIELAFDLREHPDDHETAVDHSVTQQVELEISIVSQSWIGGLFFGGARVQGRGPRSDLALFLDS